MKKIFPEYILRDTALFASAFIIASLILGAYDTTFRKGVIIAFLIISAAGVIAGTAQILLKIKKKPLNIILTEMFLLLSLCACIWIYPYAAFAFADEECVVTRDGGKYVAHVDGFFDTYVHYYEYKGTFLEGITERICEYYGEGGFNPFDSEYNAKPLETTYYDENGNVISVTEW